MMIEQQQVKPVVSNPRRRDRIFAVGDGRSVQDNVCIELGTHTDQQLSTPMALLRSRQKLNRRMSAIPKCEEEDVLGHRTHVLSIPIQGRTDGGVCASNVDLSVTGASTTRVHPYKQFITLNISGSRYCVPTDLASRRTGDDMLTRFIACTHDDRLALCSAFFEHTQEYFFAR
jgi:hypothetical protein